jgi:hypothetical protein
VNYILIAGLVILLVAVVVGFRLGWELLQQNGRMLLRMEALEKRIERKAESGKQKAEIDENAAPGDRPTGTADGDDRAVRFGNRSLANSKIKRDGLKSGTPAPEFRLPRLEGGELSLSDLRGRFVCWSFPARNAAPATPWRRSWKSFIANYPNCKW